MSAVDGSPAFGSRAGLRAVFVAESIEKAKYRALQKLHIFNPISEYDLRWLSQENWLDVKLE
jgi:hypothetical protein